MSTADVSAAIQAAMNAEGCRAEVMLIMGGLSKAGRLWCTIHHLNWDAERNECTAVGPAFRAGWAAAMESLRPKPECPGCSCDPHSDLHPFCRCEGFLLPSTEGDQP